jgi:hypothetical protein
VTKKIVESAQAAGAWVADTAKGLVDKGASMIKPSGSEGASGSETATAPESSTAAQPASATAGAEASKESTPSGGAA